jgi:nucleotide-binding universal stress UspA family protein
VLLRAFKASPAEPEGRIEMTGATGNLLKGKVNRILVPIDFSPKSAQALERAVEAAGFYGSSIWLLHVLDTMIFVGSGVPGALAEITSRSERALEELAASVRDKQIECSVLVREGDLDEQVEETISEYHIDLLVLATKAGTSMAGFNLASTAERILRKTMIPVLTVADCHKLRKWAADGCVHILYATDLSPESAHSLQFARALQHRFCAKFTLAHVLPKNASPEKVACATAKLKALASDTDNDIIVAQGPVGPTICQTALKAGADLITVGVKKHTVLREVLLGHTLLEILSGACCPVLTVRE